mgnify:FL=1
MKINKCRSCKNSDLSFAFDLGNQYLTGVFPRRKNEKISKGNLSLVFCKKCKLLQLENSFNSEEMYGDNYGYMSSLNKSMFNHLKYKVKKLLRKVSLKSNDMVIDIGSNDGTFLSFFSKKLNLVGVDPTIKKFARFYRKDIKKFSNFFSYEFLKNKITTKAKLITSIAMFYDLEDPIKFAKDVNTLLDRNGIWHLELSYMPSMLKNFSYDTICHEHLEYYSLTSIKYILDKTNFKIIDIEFNEINGGSFALTVAKKDSIHKEEKKIVSWLLAKEKLLKVNELRTFKEFFKKCEKQKKILRNLLSNLKNSGKKVYGYGASTKGNVILQFCKIDSKLIKNIGEVNPYKYNSFTPGTKIKIISESNLRKLKPDYLLVLPWHFKDFILNKEKNYLSKGVKFIFPLPDIEII